MIKNFSKYKQIRKQFIHYSSNETLKQLLHLNLFSESKFLRKSELFYLTLNFNKLYLEMTGKN
jgi:hypothetical protein